MMFAAWASAMAGAGRSEELRAALVSVVGEDRARIAMDSLAAPAAVSTAISTTVETDAPAAKQANVPRTGAGKRAPRQDRLL